MSKLSFTYQLVFTICLLTFSPSSQGQTASEIQVELASAESGKRQLLQEFYAGRSFNPAWIVDGMVTAKAIELKNSLSTLTEHGLQIRDYWSQDFEGYFGDGLQKRASPLQVELLLSQLYINAAAHINRGRIDPRKVSPEIKFTLRSFTRLVELQDGLANRAIKDVWNSMAPRHEFYGRIKSVVSRLNQISQTQPFGPLSPATVTLKPGSSHPTVKQIKERLVLMGYSIPSIDSNYDESVANAVRDIQRKNLARPTGVLSPKDSASWEFFGVSLTRRIQQAELSLEKLRWLPEVLESQYVLVNLATQRMKVVDPALQNPKLLEQNVVVGRPDRKTPSMREDLEYVVLNPTWTIPPDIFRIDKVPAIQEQAAISPQNVIDWFTQNRFTLLDSAERPVSPTMYDWLLNPPKFGEVLIRQEPGTTNALGTMKFMMPNPYSIYLHDTNAPELLSSDERMKSSGCIRLAYPRDFAEYLLSGTKWSRQAIDDFVVKPGETRDSESWIRLPGKIKIPVYLISITADLGADGVMNFTRDIYAQNLSLLKSLQAAGFYRK